MLDIAESIASRILDAARRDHWVACGDPPRPEIVPRRLLEDHGGFSTEPLESIRGGPVEFQKEQKQRYEDEHKRAAAEQIEWEAEARRDYECRRAATPLMDEGEHRSTAGGSARSGGGSAGQPAASADGTDVTNSVRDGLSADERSNRGIEAPTPRHPGLDPGSTFPSPATPEQDQ